MMKTVLITNLCFEKYTGSEFHALEIAEQFVKKGYDVTLAVFQKAYPMLSKSGSIRVVDCLTEELHTRVFDVIFVQHYPVFDYLCSKYEISYRKLVVSKLSVINDLEYLPICTPKADLILCISDECAEQVYQEIGQDERVRVFRNGVQSSWFEKCKDYQKEQKKLKRIAVISNHVPNELLDLSEVMGGEYAVDYVGGEYSPCLVDENLLKTYDLVITIGRTVPQCFALKVPVYVYDYFGGPGYITEKNVASAEFHNYSGRGEFGKKTVEELVDDIRNNYDANLANLDNLYRMANEKYRFDVNFEKIYHELWGNGNAEPQKIQWYSEEEKRRMLVYCKAIPTHRLPRKIFSKLYVDTGRGFIEENSIQWSASENYIISRKFQFCERVNGFRLDPCDEPAQYEIHEVRVNGQEKKGYREKKGTCLHYDPQLLIELTEQEQMVENISLEIVYRYKTIKGSEASGLMLDQLNHAGESINLLHKEIEKVREECRWTVGNFIKKLSKFIKR